MLKEKQDLIRKSLIFVDGLVVSLAYLLAVFLRKQISLEFITAWFPSMSGVISETNFTVNQYFIFLIAVAPLWCWMLYAQGMYRSVAHHLLPQDVLDHLQSLGHNGSRLRDDALPLQNDVHEPALFLSVRGDRVRPDPGRKNRRSYVILH